MTTERFVTFQFAGLCTLVLRKGQNPQVFVLNAIGHRPSLMVPSWSGTSGHPDQVVIVPDGGDEFGVWSLEDSEIAVKTDHPSPGKISVRTDVSNQRGKTFAMVNYSEIGKSTQLSTGLDVHCTLDIALGDIAPLLPPADREEVSYEFVDPFSMKDVEIPGAHYTARFEWKIPVIRAVTVRLRRRGHLQEPILIGPGATVMMSNGCFVCGQDDERWHFGTLKDPRYLVARQVQQQGGAEEYPSSIKCDPGFIVIG